MNTQVADHSWFARCRHHVGRAGWFSTAVAKNATGGMAVKVNR